ncbi:hypothetical protein [Candidatus Liberibacter americanus]|uniref:Uncharacterized protein n=1 Tax=Candidatus Liberibacter americanus str. Sao Paulo TaxID=1261131 RepID=U6B8L9_9HYPH|nr:hypothetical protein [Candidatus Liberibacter americanus]AHA28087.1 hypothetical protein lam_741 [Candidatus Liberibacter americanus str. Sao Paulo]EMS36065.1 hypothetical protein G653_03701 [Candidatus Liberibacter americanus PW_SP]
MFSRKKRFLNDNPLGFPVYTYSIRDLCLAAGSLLLFSGIILYIIDNNLLNTKFLSYIVVISSIIAMEVSIINKRRFYIEMFLFIIFLLSSLILLLNFKNSINDVTILYGKSNHMLEPVFFLIQKRLFIWIYFGITSILLYLYFFRYKVVASLFIGFLLSILGSFLYSIFLLHDIYGLIFIGKYGLYFIMPWMILILFIGVMCELEYSSKYFSYKELSILLNAVAFPICSLVPFYSLCYFGYCSRDIPYIQLFLLTLISFIAIVLGILFNRVSVIIANVITLFIIIYILYISFRHSTNFAVSLLILYGIIAIMLRFIWKKFRSYYSLNS